jgi:hypothetical protein
MYTKILPGVTKTENKSGFPGKIPAFSRETGLAGRFTKKF